MVDLKTVCDAIRQCWSIETTWTPERYVGRDPSTGQCAVSSVVLIELLGGTLMQGWAYQPGQQGPVRHYWAVVGDQMVDITQAQFARGWRLFDPEPATVDQVVLNAWMRERVEIFRTRVRAALGLPDPPMGPSGDGESAGNSALALSPVAAPENAINRVKT